MNCRFLASTKSKLTVVANCLDCSGLSNRQYMWQLFKNTDSWLEQDLETMADFGITSSGISIKENTLEEGEIYRLVLTYTCDECATSSFDYTFYTSMSPDGGSCSIDPDIGMYFL